MGPIRRIRHRVQPRNAEELIESFTEQIPQNIRRRAQTIITGLPSDTCGQKGVGMTGVVMYALYYAYRTLQQRHDINLLASLCHINISSVNALLARIKLFQASFTEKVTEGAEGLIGAPEPLPAVTVVRPATLIPEMCSQLKEIHTEHVPKIVKLADSLIACDESLIHELPQKLAACSILLYLESYSMAINDTLFTQTVKVTGIYGLLGRLRKLNPYRV